MSVLQLRRDAQIPTPGAELLCLNASHCQTDATRVHVALPFTGVIAVLIFKTLIATAPIRDSELLPKDLKKYLNTDLIAFDEKSKVDAPVEPIIKIR